MGAPAIAETNVDQTSSSATYGRTGKNPTSSPVFVSQLGQPIPEGRAGGKPSSPGAGSALELPVSGVACCDSDSSLCDLSPVHRSHFNVDDVTPYPSQAPRRVDAARRQRHARLNVYSAESDRLHNRSVVYINMLAVSGGTGSERA